MWPFRKAGADAPQTYTEIVEAGQYRDYVSAAGAASILASILQLYESAGLAAKSSRVELSSDCLALAFRELARVGEAVFVIAPWGLIPSSGPADVVSGGSNPATWRYRVTLDGPTQTETATLPASMVLHFRRGCLPAAPWRGRSPLRDAGIAPKTAGELESRLADMTRMAVAQLVQIGPQDRQYLDDLLPQLRRGALYLSAGGSAHAPGQLTVGPDFRNGAIEAGRALDRKLAAAYSIDPGLLGLADLDGTAAREAFRRFLHSAAAPMARIVEREAGAKLGGRVEIDLSALMAADIQGRARGFKSLTDGGMSAADAARICGFEGMD